MVLSSFYLQSQRYGWKHECLLARWWWLPLQSDKGVWNDNHGTCCFVTVFHKLCYWEFLSGLCHVCIYPIIFWIIVVNNYHARTVASGNLIETYFSCPYQWGFCVLGPVCTFSLCPTCSPALSPRFCRPDGGSELYAFQVFFLLQLNKIR